METNYVFSDTETTGLHETDFIQIIQSASILTDTEFNILDTQNILSKPLPWVIPTPGAFVTHKQIGSLDSNRSHYQMMKEIYDTWQNWSFNKKTIFFTYNGHRFDEELYRRQFYWNLLPSFTTNTNGNGRSDIMFLMLLFSYLYPDAIDYEKNKYDVPMLSLGKILSRIGVDVADAHDALKDTEFTIELMKFVAKINKDLITDFLELSTKESYLNYLNTRKYFGFVDKMFGQIYTYPLTFLTLNPEDTNKAIFLDLSWPFEDVLDMDYAELISCIAKPNKESPFKVIPINKSRALLDASKFDFRFEISQTELAKRADIVSSNIDFKEKVMAACGDIIPRSYPEKKYVDEMVYGGFPSAGDALLCEQFHQTDTFEEKQKILLNFEDFRYRELAKRILYVHYPDQISQEDRKSIENLIKTRWTVEEDKAWPSPEKAKIEFFKEMERDDLDELQKEILEKLKPLFND